MNALLAALTSLVIVVFAAAFAAPYVVDWNEYRTVFEAQASKLAGRPVRVEGDVDLTILPVPELRFEQVSIADRSGSFESASARARAFRMALSIPPLLRGKLEARKIELDRLALRLRMNARGQVAWPSLGQAAEALPFLPADVSLKSVTLNDASLAAARAGEPAGWRIEGVTGELSAESLNGPFKFAGQARIGDQTRDLQLSLGSMTSDGRMPVKAVSRGEAVVYRAEGNLRDLTSGPEFIGDLKASAPQGPGAGAQAPPWRVEATGRATLDGADFDDFSVTIARRQRPQTLDGTARLTWGQELRLDAELRSQWLDLDLLAGAKVEDRMPAEALLELPALLSDVPMPASRARIDMRIAQVSLGGDLIRDVHAVARRGDGGWGVDTLEAALPGGSGFGFDGTFARESGATVLAGTVNASGSNLGRLLHWAVPSIFKEQDASAKSFSLSGEIESTAQAFGISDISARLGDSRFGGSVRLVRREPVAADVNIEARTLDLRPYIRGGTAEMIAKLLARDDSPAALTAETWQVALRANRLILPELGVTDVDTRLRIDADGISVESLSLRGGDGLRVAGAGRYPLGETQTAPELRLTLAADSAARVEDIASVVPGARALLIPHKRRLRAAMPLNITAALRPSAVDDGLLLRVDGTAGTTQVLANARLYGGRYHLALQAENPTPRRLIRQISPALTEWLKLERATTAALVQADFVGTAGEPWQGMATLDIDDVRLAFDGKAGAQPLWFDGEVTVDAPRAGRALALAGLSAAESGPLGLRASVLRQGSVYRARDLSIDLTGQTTTGNAWLDVSGAVPDAEINLTAAHFNVARAGALLLERRKSDSAAFWPDAPFAVDALKRLSGRLSVAADTLALADGLTLENATLMARLADGALSVPMLSGMLYGGEAVASAALRPARGRMVFDGELRITELDLARLPHGAGAPLATGQADVTLRAKSEGLSPRGLTTVMSGGGKIALGAGEVRGLAPRVLARTARDYLAAEEQPEQPVAAQLAGPLRATGFAHEGAQAPLRLKDGALRVPPTQVMRGDGGQGVEARARADLTEMALTSRWDVGAAVNGEALPDVRVTFAGPLAEFGALEPRIDADDLAQFLTVARVERNVERLEELRRQREATEPPVRESAPSRNPSSASPEEAVAPAPDEDGLGASQLETRDPLPGFSTQIEETPAEPEPPAPGAAQAAEPSSRPASAATTPGAILDDPDVVEDARREIMRDTPRRPQREPASDRFFEIFRN